MDSFSDVRVSGERSNLLLGVGLRSGRNPVFELSLIGEVVKSYFVFHIAPEPEVGFPQNDRRIEKVRQPLSMFPSVQILPDLNNLVMSGFVFGYTTPEYIQIYLV